MDDFIEVSTTRKEYDWIFIFFTKIKFLNIFSILIVFFTNIHILAHFEFFFLGKTLNIEKN